MEREIKERTILDKFAEDFVNIVEKHTKYIIVSGFVAIAHGRSRGTEDIDLIIERIGKDAFKEMHNNLLHGGFECIQSEDPDVIYDDYLKDKTSVRYIRKGHFLPEMELKLARDELDEYQIRTRKKLPLTGLDIYFSSIEMNIAFTEKDIDDANHLRIIYSDMLDENDHKDKNANPQVEVIMRDRTHSEQVIRWAKYVKSHPRSVWIKEVKPLIDSQIIMANNFYERLAKTQGGIEKIRKLRDLR